MVRAVTVVTGCPGEWAAVTISGRPGNLGGLVVRSSEQEEGDADQDDHYGGDGQEQVPELVQ